MRNALLYGIYCYAECIATQHVLASLLSFANSLAQQMPCSSATADASSWAVFVCLNARHPQCLPRTMICQTTRDDHVLPLMHELHAIHEFNLFMLN